MDNVVGQAQKLAQSGQYQAAIELLDNEVMQSTASSTYVKAVCQRMLGDVDASLESLSLVLDQEPNNARAHQEVGHCFIARKSIKQAINAYENALKIDPALISSWNPLQTLYKMDGNTAGMEAAAKQIELLNSLPSEIVSARSFLNSGDLESADALCRQFLQTNKQHVEGMRLLAEIAMQAQILDDAEFILESATEFEPQHLGAKFDLATVRLKRQKFADAEKVAKFLVEQQPENPDFQMVYGSALLGVGEIDKAIGVYQNLIKANQQLKNAYLLLGHAQKTAGAIEQSIEAYQKLYEIAPDYGDAFWSLANTKTYKFSDREVAHMQDFIAKSTTSAEDKVHMNFALGKAMEDRQNYSEAFQHYQQGNALNRQLLKYAIPDIERRANRQKEVCTRELFEAREKAGCRSSEPIFILGLPRAGSTLLEQILASHSEVDGTLELPNIMSLSRRLRGRAAPKAGEEPRYPAILKELELGYFKKFGEQYIEDTQVFRQGAPRFIDKMPNNFLHIGLIKLILPNAKVIDARRHPMACCFSGFKQLFAEGQEFTYGLAEIGTYYRAYVNLMDYWDSVLPGFVLRVQHEDVVNDLESQVRRILDFCELDFEPACLEFHKTERNIRTPSSEQVRQPIYKTGLEQWRNFEAHLDPLKEALGEEIMLRYPI